MCDNSQSRTKRADHYMQEDPNSVRKRKMDSSSLHEAQNEDGKIIQPNRYQEVAAKTEDEIVETDEKTEETGEKTKKQIETITNMGYELYWAAARGEINDAMLQRKDHLQSLLTPNKNTVLHIYITSITAKHLEPTKFVEEILTMCPELLMQPNKKKETPLHIAAKYGHASIVELLIQHAKALHPHNLESSVEAARQMMRMPNQNQDTALHEAVRFQHLSVVKILIEEDSDFVYLANEDGETPLYMAAERGYSHIVFEILDNCKSPATGGPNGRNVLHAATVRQDEEMIKRILGKMVALMLKEADKMGRTPLHYAAFTGYIPAVKLFLELPIGREAAYMKDTEGNTALHLAAALNHKETTLEIIRWCPECSELVNNKGWNILHSSVHNRDTVKLAMDIIVTNNALSNLLNEKDAEGNTPLHHIAISLNSFRVDLIDHPGVDKVAFNKEDKNALDLAFTSKTVDLRKKSFIRRLRKSGLRLGIRTHIPVQDDVEDKRLDDDSALSILDEAKDANLIVAALIATVTFTAGFTVPGGFFSEKGQLQGTPILGKSSAFKTFIIMDTIAMVLSSSAVFVHIFLGIGQDMSRLICYYMVAFVLTTLAMAAMVLAFVTGTYAMLGYSTALSVVTCVIGLSFFIFFFKLFKNTFSPYV